MMAAASANGLDLYASNPDFRSNLGKAPAGRRSQFILQGHICSCWQDGQYKRSRAMADIVPAFEDQLRRLGTDYIDMGMIHYVDALKDWREISDGPILPYVQDLKAKGVIKAISMSSHNPQVALAAEGQAKAEPLLKLIEQLSREKNASPSQISLAWVLAKRPFIVPIPGSSKSARIRENADAVNINLTAAEMAAIDGLLNKSSFDVSGENEKSYLGN